jgi:hypothetical protein
MRRPRLQRIANCWRQLRRALVWLQASRCRLTTDEKALIGASFTGVSCCRRSAAAQVKRFDIAFNAEDEVARLPIVARLEAAGETVRLDVLNSGSIHQRHVFGEKISGGAEHRRGRRVRTSPGPTRVYANIPAGQTVRRISDNRRFRVAANRKSAADAASKPANAITPATTETTNLVLLMMSPKRF